MSDEKIGDYFMAARRVLTNVFGKRKVMAYVTAGIEILVNLINIAYCAMKILPYQNKVFSEYRTKSVQEFRFVLSAQIRE